MLPQKLTYPFLLILSLMWFGCPSKSVNTNEEAEKLDSIPVKKNTDLNAESISAHHFDTFGPRHMEWGESSISFDLERTKKNKISGSVVVKMRNPDTKNLCLDKYISTIAVTLGFIDFTFPEGLVYSAITEKDFMLGDSLAVTQIASKYIVEEIVIVDSTIYIPRWEFTIDHDPTR